MRNKANTQWYINAEENHYHQIGIVYATIKGDKNRNRYFIREIPIYDTVKLTAAVININYEIYNLGFNRVLDLTKGLRHKWLKYHQFNTIKKEVDKDNPF